MLTCCIATPQAEEQKLPSLFLISGYRALFLVDEISFYC